MQALPGDEEESYKPSVRSVRVDKEGKSYETLAVVSAPPRELGSPANFCVP